ncbi:MAG: hypothetical protein R3C14_14070 [Caldilineaceae bacterium]
MYKAKEIIYGIEYNNDRAKGLLIFARDAQHLANTERLKILQDIIKFSTQEYYGKAEIASEAAKVLAILAHHEIVLNFIQSISSENIQRQLLIESIPYLYEIPIHQALELANDLKGCDGSDAVWAELAVRLVHQGNIDKSLSLIQELVEAANKNTRWRNNDTKPLVKAFTQTVKVLSDQQLQRMIHLAEQTESKEAKSEILISLICRLAELGQFEKALSMVEHLPMSCQEPIFCPQIKALVNLSDLTSDYEKKTSLINRARDSITDIEDKTVRGIGLITLAYYYPQSEFRQMMLEALELLVNVIEKHREYGQQWDLSVWDGTSQKYIRLIPFTGFVDFDAGWKAMAKLNDPRHRALVLADVVPYLSETQLRDAMLLAAGLDDKEGRFSALRTWAVRVGELPIEKSASLMQELLHLLAARTRKDFLSDLSALAPLIVKMGGVEGVKGVIDSVKNVGQWWP